MLIRRPWAAGNRIPCRRRQPRNRVDHVRSKGHVAARPDRLRVRLQSSLGERVPDGECATGQVDVDSVTPMATRNGHTTS